MSYIVVMAFVLLFIELMLTLIVLNESYVLVYHLI